MTEILVSGQIPSGQTRESITGRNDVAFMADLPFGYDLREALEPHIQKADGYVILPGADPLVTTSLIVDYQDELQATNGKPFIIYSPDEKPSPFVSVMEELRERGFLRKPLEDLFTIAKSIDEIPDKLAAAMDRPEPPEPDYDPNDVYEHLVDELNAKGAQKDQPKRHIAVFTSASNMDPDNLELAYETGRLIAQKGFGLMFGGSNVSMMGKSAEGAHAENGFVSGVSIPAFFGKELVESGNDIHIDHIKIVDDIYGRMHDMISDSDALVVLPGGIGTVQEVIAVMKMREAEPELASRPVVLVNHDGFWDKLGGLMQEYGYEMGRDFHMVDDVNELDALLDKELGPANDAAPATLAPAASKDPADQFEAATLLRKDGVGGWRDARATTAQAARRGPAVNDALSMSAPEEPVDERPPARPAVANSGPGFGRPGLG